MEYWATSGWLVASRLAPTGRRSLPQQSRPLIVRRNATLSFRRILMPRLTPLRIAIDTGGTFTDCVWVQDGQVQILKVFSTTADPSLAIADAIARIAPDRSIVLLHGTTVGTNTLLQRKGARVALVTTAGFEDVIEIG